MSYLSTSDAFPSPPIPLPAPSISSFWPMRHSIQMLLNVTPLHSQCFLKNSQRYHVKRLSELQFIFASFGHCVQEQWTQFVHIVQIELSNTFEWLEAVCETHGFIDWYRKSMKPTLLSGVVACPFEVYELSHITSPNSTKVSYEAKILTHI